MSAGLALPADRHGVPDFLNTIRRDLEPVVAVFSEHHGDLGPHLSAQIEALPPEQRPQAQRIRDHWDSLPAPTDLESALPWWDFRLGDERDAIPLHEDLLTPEVSAVVYDLSRDWELLSSHTPEGYVDVVLVLGGLITADFARPGFLSDVLATGTLRAGRVIGLAGNRRLSPWERREPGADACTTEAEALALGFTKAGISDFEIAVAPDERGRRATTASSVGSWLSEHPRLRSSGRLTSVTSSIYRVRNHVDVLTQTKGCQVVTASVAGPALLWRPQRYLQEIKAAAEGLPALWKWAELI